MTSDDAITAAFCLYVHGFLRRGWCVKGNSKKQSGAGENLRVFTVLGTIAKIQFMETGCPICPVTSELCATLTEGSQPRDERFSLRSLPRALTEDGSSTVPGLP